MNEDIINLRAMLEQIQNKDPKLLIDMCIKANKLIPEWIKCTERFPVEGKQVLVWDGNLNLDNEPTYDLAEYRTFNNGSFFICGPYTLQGITHWMPLPESPRSENE